MFEIGVCDREPSVALGLENAFHFARMKAKGWIFLSAMISVSACGQAGRHVSDASPRSAPPRAAPQNFIPDDDEVQYSRPNLNREWEDPTEAPDVTWGLDPSLENDGLREGQGRSAPVENGPPQFAEKEKSGHGTNSPQGSDRPLPGNRQNENIPTKDPSGFQDSKSPGKPAPKENSNGPSRPNPPPEEVDAKTEEKQLQTERDHKASPQEPAPNDPPRNNNAQPKDGVPGKTSSPPSSQRSDEREGAPEKKAKESPHGSDSKNKSADKGGTDSEKAQPDSPGAGSKGQSEFDPSLLAPGSSAKDFVLRGSVIPTVYYRPVVRDDEKTCSRKKVPLHGPDGKSLIDVCPETFANCLMQGSCVIVRRGIERSFNVTSGTRRIFSEIHETDCTFGYGVKGICIDPFYSVAADLKHYKPGDVIFVPAVVGLTLPSGGRHSGFFVVRDRGGAIQGKDRFDFFSGDLHYLDSRNPFGQIKLADRRTRLVYYQVNGKTAQKILHARAFPEVLSPWRE